MKRRNTVIGLLVALGGAGLVAVGSGMGQPATQKPAAPAPAAKDSTWTVDPVHSSIAFRIKHFNTAYFYGRFNEMTGSLTKDENGLSGMELTIKIASVDTNNTKRDGHLKQADFFNAEKYPTATFKSTKVMKKQGVTSEITGDLTIRGVTKSVTVSADMTGQGKGPGGEIVGFEILFDLKRSDFGMNYMLDGLSDEVKMAVSIEAGKK